MITALMIMLIIPPKLAPAVATIEIALNTMLIIDKIKVTVQAHPLPFSSPYATTNETIAIAISTIPIAILNHGSLWRSRRYGNLSSG
jgi:hypothetical protein